MMKRQTLKIIVLTVALIFFNGTFPLSLALATSVPSQNIDVEVIVKVSQKGFADQHGKLFGPKYPLKIPTDKIVRITFVFNEQMSTLAYGDTHQIAIAGLQEQVKESEKIWMFNQQAGITFQSGKEGEQYRAYCIVDCLGMEHLNNLLIKVG